MERVVGNVPIADDFPDVALAPVSEGIELHDAARGVVFLRFQFGSRAGLVAALARDPGCLSRERALQRLDLADVAAAFAQLHALVKRVAAEARDILGDRSRVGLEDLHFVAVAFTDRSDHVERVRVQPPGIQREDLDAEPEPQYHLGNHHVFRGQARGERHRRVLEGNAPQQPFEIGGLLCQRAAHDFRAARRRLNKGIGRSTEVWYPSLKVSSAASASRAS